MKITINKTIKEEIELPKYWQSASCYHTAMDDKSALELDLRNTAIKKVHLSTATVCGIEEITEEDFNLRLNEIKQILNL
jgi:hypothetical protein